jgi:hypothetical protein
MASVPLTDAGLKAWLDGRKNGDGSQADHLFHDGL